MSLIANTYPIRLINADFDMNGLLPLPAWPPKRWKIFFQRYQQNAVKNFFTAKIANLENVYRADLNAFKSVTDGAVEQELVDMHEVRESDPCTAGSFL